MIDDSTELVNLYFHGSSISDLGPGDLILPPDKTGKISEKGRKKNLDKVFFTKDPKSALIYAGRAVQSMGGGIATVYLIDPQGPIVTLNDTPGTTVYYSPYAKVLRKISTKDLKKLTAKPTK